MEQGKAARWTPPHKLDGIYCPEQRILWIFCVAPPCILFLYKVSTNIGIEWSEIYQFLAVNEYSTVFFMWTTAVHLTLFPTWQIGFFLEQFPRNWIEIV